MDTSDPDFKEDIVFNSEHPNWILHKELLKACKKKAAGHYYVGMPDLMEGLDVLAALKGTDKVLLDTVHEPEVLEHRCSKSMISILRYSMNYTILSVKEMKWLSVISHRGHRVR